MRVKEVIFAQEIWSFDIHQTVGISSKDIENKKFLEDYVSLY